MVGEGRPAGEVKPGVDIRGNLEFVRERIARAAGRAGRDPSEITLVVVTKTVPVELINEAVGLGVTDIGENRVQEARLKSGAVTSPVRWHMIGHLQSNKARAALQVFDIIHSVDRLSLATELNRIAAETGRMVKALVQVNVSGEESKFGIAPPDVAGFVEKVSRLGNVAVEGLMTIAPFVADPEDARPCFRGLREVSQAVAKMGLPRVEMNHLSMGMSNDFEVAIEEGASIVRLGTAIFGPRPAL